MSKKEKWDTATGYAFLAGFVLGKMRYLPISILPNLLTMVTTIASLGASLLGYLLWSIASRYYPEHKHHEQEWYGFAQYKEQHLASATIGVIASAISIIGFFIPALYPPAACLFLCSNIFWCISEYHKLKNPPIADSNYSHSHQESYVNYTISMTGIALNTAIAAVLVFLFPLITVPLVITTTIITVGLSVLSLEFWLDCKFGKHEKSGSPPGAAGSSHQHIASRLGISNTVQYQSAIEMAPMQEHHDSPLISRARSTALAASDDSTLQLDNQACHGPC